MKNAKRAMLILLSAAMLFAAGCIKTPEATAPLPQDTMTPDPLATQTPGSTPPSSTTSGYESPGTTADPRAGEYPLNELVGVADPGDVIPPFESFEEAKSKNPDVIGWITVPGTCIDYPVVRCDNNDYYLGRNVKREKSKHGAIFMDYRNADTDQQRHIIIWGHNMKNGTMFHDLMNYKQRDFFDENRYVYLLWDGTETVWQIYLAAIVSSPNVFYIETRFGSDENFADFMAEMIAYAKTVQPSNVDTGVTIRGSDQVLTLSTCTYEYDDSRFAVQAKRIK